MSATAQSTLGLSEQAAMPAGAASVSQRAHEIAEQVTAAHADAVDREARFPAESVQALREARLLGAMIPQRSGGEGASTQEIAEATFTLATRCASSAMVFAMHQLQVACLMQHAKTTAEHRFLQEVAGRQLLLASSTTEVGVGGKLRESICAVQRSGDRFRLRKEAQVVSYGNEADAVLVTARRGADSAPNDQVLVIATGPGLTLTQVSDWDVLGLRGTCSPGFLLEAEGAAEMVLEEPFADIADRTMGPVSHVLWSFVWLGIAAAAESRARRFVQAQARKNPGATAAAGVRLAELGVIYQQMDAMARAALARLVDDQQGAPRASAAIDSNALKVGISTMLVEVVSRALSICGMAGYRNDTPFSLGRHLRDAHGAALMVNNDRLLADNAQLLMIHREAP